MARLTRRVSIIGAAFTCAFFLTAGTSSAALPRSTSDRPDDHAGPQVHFVYAVPSDQLDQNLDADGTLEGSVNAIQAYLRSQTGGPGLKVDTSSGAPDITFVRLPRSDADYAAQPEVAAGVVDDLAHAGLTDPNKVYSIYYEGSAPSLDPSFALCGEGGRTGRLLVAVVIMHDHCGYDLAASRSGVANALEFVLLHESLHAMGFVPICAPHHSDGNHVDDSPEDLMAPVLPSGTPILDLNHDDYFQANHAGCLDLSQSRFLEGAGTTVTVAVGGTAHGHVRGQILSPSFGNIDCPPACSATFDGGQSVSLALAAIAEPGYVFARWEGACTGTAPNCTVRTTSSATATAVFAKAPPPPVALTVSVTGAGLVTSTPAGILCSSRCTGKFAAKSKVRLRAKPARGWRFAGWSGACRGRVPCFVPVTHARSVRATFRRI